MKQSIVINGPKGSGKTVLEAIISRQYDKDRRVQLSASKFLDRLKSEPDLIYELILRFDLFIIDYATAENVIEIERTLSRLINLKKIKENVSVVYLTEGVVSLQMLYDEGIFAIDMLQWARKLQKIFLKTKF